MASFVTSPKDLRARPERSDKSSVLNPEGKALEAVLQTPAWMMIPCSLPDIKGRLWTPSNTTISPADIPLSFAAKRLDFAAEW